MKYCAAGKIPSPLLRKKQQAPLCEALPNNVDQMPQPNISDP